VIFFVFVVCVFVVFGVGRSGLFVGERVASGTGFLFVQQVEECVDFVVEEMTYGTCLLNRTVFDCVDAPLNLSCSVRVVNYRNDTCVVGLENVTLERCVVTGYLIDTVRVSTEGYSCRVTEDNVTLILCDSLYDGNGDGLCSSGESCVKFSVVGDVVERQERNSQDVWVDTDTTYFLSRASSEVFS